MLASACQRKKDCKALAIRNWSLLILHSVEQQLPFIYGELLDCHAYPDHEVDKQELELQVHDALHRHRDRSCEISTLRMPDYEDRVDDAREADIDADYDNILVGMYRP